MPPEAQVEDRLVESQGTLVEGTLRPNDDGGGEVWVDLIAEGFGNPRDKHYYTGDVLQESAPLFENAKMYANHLLPEDLERRKGYPRDIQDIMGRILEVQPDLAEANEGGRALRARVNIVQPWLWNMVKRDPALLGVSINARGHSRPGKVEEQDARIVESIRRVVSVDWVGEPGAGGRVRELAEQMIEAQLEGDDVDPADELREDHETEPEDNEEPQTEASSEPEAEGATEDGPPEGDLDGEEPEAEVEEEPVDDPEAEPEVEGDLDEGWEEIEEAEPQRVNPNTPWNNSAWNDPDIDGEIEGDPGNQRVSEIGPSTRMTRDDMPSAQTLERQIEARFDRRLRELRAEDAQTLEEAIQAATERAQERFEEALQAEREKHARALAQVSQRYSAAAVIDETDLPAATKRALKAEFHDYLAEARAEEDGSEVDADTVLMEAVSERIQGKRGELAEFTEARIEGAGESGEGRRDGPPAERRPKQAPLDEKVDEVLGIAEPAAADE